MQLQDFDQDGRLDLLFEHFNENGSEVSIQLSSDQFGQSLSNVSLGQFPAFFLEVGDFDGDSDPDVISIGGGVVSEPDEPPTFQWFPNDLKSSGGFGAPVQLPIEYGFGAQEIAVGDIDNDGDVDVVAAVARGINWFENLDGQGTFSVPKLVEDTSLSGNVLEVADMDLDGDLDLVAAVEAEFNSTEAEIVWYENLDGKGTFDDETGRHVVGDYPGGVHFVAEDVDNDGDVDVLTITDLWESNASELVPPLEGDINLDGEVKLPGLPDSRQQLWTHRRRDARRRRSGRGRNSCVH